MSDASQTSNGAERREHLRAPLEVKVEYARMNAFFADYTQNISKGGTFIKTTTPLPLETELVFSLRLPKQIDPLRVRGRVVRVLGPESSEPGMGIRFVYDTEADQQQFESAVEQLIKESLGEQAYAHLGRKKA